MTTELSENVEVPVWALKLAGYLTSGIIVGLLGWASWVSIAIIRYEAKDAQFNQMSAEVKTIDARTLNMQRSIDGIVARFKWEQEKTTQTKLP